MKLCKDCKWIEDYNKNSPLCNHQKASHSVYDGSAHEICSIMRMEGSYCGPEALLFEAK
jgi:hypothetical protein